MPKIQQALKQTSMEKSEITQRVNKEHINPTEDELEKSNMVIKAISEEFAEVLLEKDIKDVSFEIKAAVAKKCGELNITFEEQKRIEKTVLSMALGHGPIEVYLNDPGVTEIVIQRFDNIVIEKNGKVERTDVTFANEEQLMIIIKRIVQQTGRQINLSTPIVDARLADGSRVNATIPPVSPDGATMTIRKFNNKVLSGRDYIRFGSLNKEMLYFLERCVRGAISMFVSGGTGTGKTTLLNMLSAYIPADNLIVTIEDTCELKLQQPNVRRKEVRLSGTNGMLNVDQKTLVKNALRERPDRIILGEVRDGSIVDLISAMSTGHEGSMSTIHANSPKNMCDVRIPILYSMNDEAHFSESSIAMQIAEAIQIIVQITRLPDGSRKLTHISHVDGLTANGKVNVKDIFVYDRNTDSFRSTGYIPKKIIKMIRDKGLDFNEKIFEQARVRSQSSRNNQAAKKQSDEKVNSKIPLSTPEVNQSKSDANEESE